MYAIIVGGGVKGVSVLREMEQLGWEVLLIEKDGRRYEELESTLEHLVLNGDGADIDILRSAGAARADILIAATDSDASNIVISQIAKDEFKIDLVLPLVNQPQNKGHFEALGLDNPISIADTVIARINHALPHMPVVPLLDLKAENLEILEIEITAGMPASGKRVSDLKLPDGARLVSRMRDGRANVVRGDTIIVAGDRVLVVLEPEYEDEAIAILCAKEPIKKRRKRKRKKKKR